MFSTKSVGRNLFTFLKKLGLSDCDSKKSYERFATVEGSSKNIQSPRGYVTMYVGEERKRYQVPLKYLSLPKFQELIIQSEDDDLDIKVDGPITLACTTESFDQLMKLAKKH